MRNGNISTSDSLANSSFPAPSQPVDSQARENLSTSNNIPATNQPHPFSSARTQLRDIQIPSNNQNLQNLQSQVSEGKKSSETEAQALGVSGTSELMRADLSLNPLEQPVQTVQYESEPQKQRDEVTNGSVKKDNDGEQAGTAHQVGSNSSQVELKASQDRGKEEKSADVETVDKSPDSKN